MALPKVKIVVLLPVLFVTATACAYMQGATTTTPEAETSAPKALEPAGPVEASTHSVSGPANEPIPTVTSSDTPETAPSGETSSVAPPKAAPTVPITTVSIAEETVTEPVAKPVEIPAATPPAPIMIDISDQYTGTDGPVPVIENAAKCNSANPELRIVVERVPETRGMIVADLHDNVRENFLKGDKVVLRVRTNAQQGETSFCIPLPTPGEYAVAFYHDKNNNQKFDKNFLGIPKERFGMSNNPRFGTRAPKYEQAVFTVPATGADLRIKLRKASDILGGQN